MTKLSYFCVQVVVVSSLLVVAAASAAAQSVTLTFEGLKDGEPVLNYYNAGTGGLGSGPGPNYGITFGADAIAGIAASAGGGGNFSGNPSGVTIVTFLSGPGVVMNVSAGFRTGFSFYYASGTNTGNLTVYDGVNGTGAPLATIQLAATGGNCNNSTYVYSCWVSKGVTFNGIAKSVNFSGVTNGIGFDNITLGSATPGGPSFTITTTSLPNGNMGSPYSATLSATGGRTPYSWGASGLPAGLSLNSSTGVISGTSTTAGTFNVSVTVTDSSSPKLSANATLPLTISQGVTITTTSLPNATLNVPYSVSLTASGGRTPYSWTGTGLPSGLTLNGSNGVISGTPTSTGTFNVTLTVSDSSSPKLTKSSTFPLTVSQGVTITTTSLPAGTVNSPYNVTLSASGGRTPYTWTASGLPAGLSLNSSSGAISGSPSSAGGFTVSITVSDSSSPKLSATSPLTLTINNPSTPISGVQVAPSTITAITDHPIITVSFGSPAPTPMIATLALSFVANAAGLPANYSDPGLQFGQGGTTTTVNIPQGATSVSLPTSNSIQIGSVAGTIVVTLTRLVQVINGQQQPVTLPNPLPSISIVVPRLIPSIASVKIINVTSSGFTVDVVASSTPRDLSAASFTFNAAPGAQLNGTTFTIGGNGSPLASAAASWFGNGSGQAAGGTFDLQIPFTYSGDTSAIGSVSVTLTNSAGNSNTVSGTM